MGASKFVNRLLSDWRLRRQALEFVRVFIANSPGYRPEPSFNQGEVLDLVLHEAQAGGPSSVDLASYLADSKNREFSKLFLLCLIASFHPFQPNTGKEWKDFSGLINGMLREGLIMDPVTESGMNRDELGEEESGEYLIEPAGEKFIWSAIRKHIAAYDPA